MSLTRSQLEFCRSLVGEALMAAPLPNDPLATLTVLRKECSAEQAAAILEVRKVRVRAAESGKLPAAWAARVLGSGAMLQQASSLRLAVYVGRRLVQAANDRQVLDLCCGMGIDAIGLALAGAGVTGCDIADQAVLCAAHNAEAAGLADRCRFLVADAEGLSMPAGAVVHIDPDRRPAGRRSIRLDDCSPGRQFLRGLPARTAAGAMKLSPAVGYQALADWPGVRLEYVSEAGACRQLLVWWGIGKDGEDRPPACGPPPPPRTATVVFGEMAAPESASLAAGESPPAEIAERGRTGAPGKPGQWLIEPDPAVIAAGAVDDLAANLAAQGGASVRRIDPRLAWLLSDRAMNTPLARCYHILRIVPGRQGDVARAVRELGGGVVEVKPCGLRLDTDTLQQTLRGAGGRPLAILWGKVGRRQAAFIAERPPQAAWAIA
jgi:hypothetical protein